MNRRAFDLMLLLPVLPFYLSFIGALTVVALLAHGRPIFFTQPRVGRHRKPFRILKLRTMTTEPDVAARKPTRFGAFMRQRGLDEMPQLINVLFGDMSLVGPRPLEPKDVDRLVAKHPPFAARFETRPGLTGPAQVAQISGVEATAQLEADYAARATAADDLGLLARTAWINLVGKRRGHRPVRPGSR